MDKESFEFIVFWIGVCFSLGAILWGMEQTVRIIARIKYPKDKE